MKNKKVLFKIYGILLAISILSLIILSILGNKNRKGYLSDFVFDENHINKTLELNGLNITETKNLFIKDAILDNDALTNYIFTNESIKSYSYSFRIKYYSKVFRNSDIYGIYIDTNKIIQDNDFIKEIRFDENGSPFGILTSTKELMYDEKIDDIDYKLKIKLPILVLFIILFIYLSINIVIIKNRKKLSLEYLNKIKFVFIKYKKAILIFYSALVILFILFVIINSNIKYTSKLTDLELIAESRLGYVYRGKIDLKDSKLFSINNDSIKINNANDIKYYGYALEITNKPLGSWHSTNISYTSNNTFIISNESTNENGYYYNIQVPTYIGDKYKITILAKQLPEIGNIKWHLNGYNNFKEITKKEVSNGYIVLTDIRDVNNLAGGVLELYFIMPQGVTEIESILIESLNTNLNLENGYFILTTKNNISNNFIYTVSYNIYTKYQISNILILFSISVLLIIFDILFSKYNYSKIVNIIFILLYAFISFPELFPVGDYIHGLDNSWIYYINILADSYFKFGKDVIFTYGPLGYIISAIDIHNNLIISFIFKVTIYFINVLSLYFLIKDLNATINRKIIAIMIFLVYFSPYIMYFLFDYYLSFTIVLLLLLDIKYNNYMSYILSCIFIVISFFIKLSSGILNFGILFTYLFSLLIYKDRKLLINRTIISLIIPILIFLLYMIYNPNISDFFTYVKGSLDISSGYIYAMGVADEGGFGYYASIITILAYSFAIIYSILIIYYFIKRDFHFVYLFIFSILFHLTYKHAFVRHNWILIYPFTLIIAFLLLFNNSKKINYIFVISFIIFSFLYRVNYIELLKMPYNKINNIKLTIDTVNPKDNKTQYKGYELPKDILSYISTNTVTIYPWEISYIISNKLNFKPMPIFQAYSAYTPYLDKLNADFFDNESAPEYIIFEWEAIDFRLPFTDTPLTFQKIYDNYYLYNVYDAKYMLLKKRQTKLNHTIKSNYTQKMNIYKDKIYFDNITNSYIILKSDIDLNILGKIYKIIYQIPAIYANIETYEGKRYSFRILLPQLKNGIIINKLPTSLYELNSFFSNNLEDSVKSISFSGEGLYLYKKDIDINVDIVEIK